MARIISRAEAVDLATKILGDVERRRQRDREAEAKRYECPECADLRAENARLREDLAHLRDDAGADSCADYAERNAELETEVARLREELIEALWDVFHGAAFKVKEGHRAGWWDSMSRSDVCNAGDRLVEFGLLERHPEGFGRRWFYREPVVEGGD